MMMMMERLDRNKAAGVVVLGLLVVINAAISYQNARAIRAGSEPAAHTEQVLVDVAAARSNLHDMEVAQRNFLLLGDEPSQAGFQRAAARVDAAVEKLARLTSEDAGQSSRTTALREAVRTAYARLLESIRIRRELGLEAVRAPLAIDSWRATLETCERRLDAVVALEQTLVARRRAVAAQSFADAMLFGGASAAFGLAAVIAFAWFLSREAAMWRRAEEARARLAAIVESSADAIIGMTPEGLVQTWNAGAEALFDRAAEETVGRPIAELIVPPELREESHGVLRRVVRGEPVETFETVRMGRGGRRVEVSATVSPIHDPSGRVVGVSKVLRDVGTRNRAERQAREVEARFRTLFEQGGLFAGVLSIDGEVLEANRACLDSWGLHREEVVGRPFWECPWWSSSPELAETIRNACERAAAGESSRTEELYHAADGTERTMDLAIAPVVDDAGRALFLAATGTDVTDRRRAEAGIREKDQRLQLLLGNATDYAVVISDPEGIVVDWAGGAEAITGHAAADVLGRPADVIFTPEERAADVPAREMETAAREGRAEDKRWHVRKDGSTFFAEGVMVPLREDGVLHGFGKLFRDATARRRSEEGVRFLADAGTSIAELVDYESTFQRIARLAVGGFADWCAVDLVEENGNRRRLALNHSRPGEARNWTDADLDGLVENVLRTGEPEVVHDLAGVGPGTLATGGEWIVRLAGGGVRSYLCAPILSRGRVAGALTFLSASGRRWFGPEQLRVAQDLAERVAAAMENSRLYRELQEVDRRKDEFLATLAHELRNPLAPVRNGIQVLRLGGHDPAARLRAVDMMDRQIVHLVRLVDDLMDVSRVNSGKVALRLEPVDLREIVEAAVETSRQMIDAGGHALEIHTADDPLPLEADRTRLVQVLANLLNNAAKYTPHGGRIELTAGREGTEAVVRVTDSGVGISAEMLPRVFDMFTQIGLTIDRSQGGLGIGLTLVRRLVEMHGGTVSARSEGTGRGSTLIVRLPLARPSPVAEDPVSAAAVVPSPSRLNVLVVDDNHDSAESLAILLGLKGHEVRTAHDGPEALRALETFRPHLILLDLGLPGMTGFEVARRIRASSGLRDVRLAALTGWGQDEDRRRTREAGFDHHLVKPADPDAVEAVLAALHAIG